MYRLNISVTSTWGNKLPGRAIIDKETIALYLLVKNVKVVFVYFPAGLCHLVTERVLDVVVVAGAAPLKAGLVYLPVGEILAEGQRTSSF